MQMCHLVGIRWRLTHSLVGGWWGWSLKHSVISVFICLCCCCYPYVEIQLSKSLLSFEQIVHCFLQYISKSIQSSVLCCMVCNASKMHCQWWVVYVCNDISVLSSFETESKIMSEIVYFIWSKKLAMGPCWVRFYVQFLTHGIQRVKLSREKACNPSEKFCVCPWWWCWMMFEGCSMYYTAFLYFAEMC